MGPVFACGMRPAWGGRTVVMYFHELVYSLFPIAIGIVVSCFTLRRYKVLSMGVLCTLETPPVDGHSSQPKANNSLLILNDTLS